jgi:Putative peptidoglycan binding domain
VRDRVWPCAGGVLAVVTASFTITAAPAGAAFGDRALSRGDSGRDVRVLQRWLGYVGFRTTIDGQFGRRTARAVRRYERRQDFRVDGRVSRIQARGLRKRARRAYAARHAERALPAPGERAVLNEDGTASAPASAPQPVKDAIAAANRIVDKPYKYGGGHGEFEDDGYDCSGTVSYALHGAGLLKRARDSSGLRTFGESGEGQWMTVYAHGGHAFIVIAGLRLDTSGRGEEGPRWRKRPRSGKGYTVRHPRGL